jgi:hypothetical protein
MHAATLARMNTRSHWLAQSHLTAATQIQQALNGDESKAAHVHALAQRLPEYRGHELLLARLLATHERASALGPQAGAAQLRAVIDALRSLAAEHAALRNRAIAPTSAGSGQASSEWAEAQPALARTEFVRDGHLTPEATTQLNAAREALAREVGQPLDSIPRAAAALRVASDYWTARIGREPAAFEQAHHAQEALTQAMGPLRAQAKARGTLAQHRSDYQATIASIRELEPGFDEGTLGATQVGEVTLSQLESAMPAEDFAELKLSVARQYLARYRAIANDPATRPAKAFLDSVTPAIREGWERRLTGGSTLNAVVAAEVGRGGDLSVERIDQAVRRAQVVGPPRLPDLPSQVSADRFYELRYGNADEARAQLDGAMTNHPNLPMQIRTPDGSRRLDIYRHGSEQNGSMIIDQRDGSALPLPDGLVAAIVNRLGIDGGGALVVSYGSEPHVMAERPRIYRSTAGVLLQAIDNPASNSTASSQLLRQVNAQRNLPPAERRLAQIERGYQSFLLSLETAVAERVDHTRPIRVDPLSTSLRQSAARLQSDAPESIKLRAQQIGQSVKFLLDTQNSTNGSFGWSAYLNAERKAHPPAAGHSVIEHGLNQVRDLMRQHRVPTKYLNPLWEAKLLTATVGTRNGMTIDLAHATRASYDYGHDQTFSKKQLAQIASSPTRFFEYLSQSPGGWQLVADKAGLNTSIRLDHAQAQGRNGGVPTRAQLSRIGREPDRDRQLQQLISARDGFAMLDRDFQDQLVSAPDTLRPDRPRYLDFARMMMRPPLAWALAHGEGSIIREDARLKAATLDLIGSTERDLIAHRDAPEVRRAVEATIDARITNLTTGVQWESELVVHEAVLMLRNFRALIDRLYPPAPRVPGPEAQSAAEAASA